MTTVLTTTVLTTASLTASGPMAEPGALLADGYDVALFDLDGVIYLGPDAVPGVVRATDELLRLGKKLMYVTNNAARSAEVVVQHLRSLGYTAELDMVLSSAQVASAYLGEKLAKGTKVLVAGTENLRELIAAAGLTPVASADDGPEAVILGYDPEMSWPLLDEACLAIGRGAVWYACNDDSSRPTQRGVVMGVGGMIASIRAALGGDPFTFGKPFRPMMDEAVRRTKAKCPIFVGDRIDTDIIGANQAQMDSLMVFTGVHGKHELVAAGPGERPTAIGKDVSALLLPPRRLSLASLGCRNLSERAEFFEPRGPRKVSQQALRAENFVGQLDGGADCDGQRAVLRAGEIVLLTDPSDLESQLSALWAVANLAWANPGIECAAALRSLDLVG
ncbi:MAG: HAD-IIA family hydrolase [Propionibacteriaceae bacterium]|nr:HAD-IIA family hydrolase [Propionibacteriaceae bacterium]